MELPEHLVSVVVPTFNRRASLQRLLEALAQQTYPPERFEVVVVDDGSTDGTAEQARSLGLPYTLKMLRQSNQGPAQARNLGVAEARGALVVFLDDDVVPRPHLIAAHVAAHQVHPNAVVIGPMSPPPDEWPRPAWVRWEEDLLQIQYQDMLAGKYPCGPRQFYTGNASLSRQQFLEAGGFDPRFKRAEDVELAYRLRDRGARFVFRPEAEVWHYASRSFESWCRTPYQYGRYDVAMYREKGHEALPCAFVEFHRRHVLTRQLVRLCLGRPALARMAVQALRWVATGSDWGSARRAGRLALSAAFNVLYWQGVSDEFGDAAALQREIAIGACGRYPAGPATQAQPPVAIRTGEAVQ
jgi:GT2 family glycosyltransferase